MDKKGIIQEHSKIKLELYRLYLERYLSVLLAAPYCKSIAVNDIFAGCGISDNDEKGSAIIATETIEQVKVALKANTKPISLNLNDANKASCIALQKHLKNHSFVKITAQDANEHIKSWVPASGSHNLFFIDPHGYTQVETQNLKGLELAPPPDQVFPFHVKDPCQFPGKVFRLFLHTHAMR